METKKNTLTYIGAISAIIVLLAGSQGVLAVCELCYETFTEGHLEGSQLGAVLRNGNYIFVQKLNNNSIIVLNATDHTFIDDLVISPTSIKMSAHLQMIPYSTNGVIFSHVGSIKKVTITGSTLSLTGVATLCLDNGNHRIHQDGDGRIWSSCFSPNWVYSINPNSFGTVSQSPEFNNFNNIKDVIYDTDTDLLYVYGDSEILLYEHIPPFSFELFDEYTVTSTKLNEFTGPDFSNEVYLYSSVPASKTDYQVLNITNDNIELEQTLDLTDRAWSVQLCVVTVCDADFLMSKTNGFFNIWRADNNTLIASLACGIDCSNVALGQDTTSENYWYSTSAGNIVVFNTTDFTQDLGGGNNGDGNIGGNGTGGNGTGGGGGGGGGTGTTCNPDISNPFSNTLWTNLNNWYMSSHVVDCENNDIKTNGLGFIIIILLLALMMMFFIFIMKRKYVQNIPNYVWLIGTFAIIGFGAGVGLVEPWFLILGIIICIVFFARKMWMPALKIGGDSE